MKKQNKRKVSVKRKKVKTKSNPVIYHIITLVDPDVDYSPLLFKKKVQSVLLDKEGWQSIANVKFKFVNNIKEFNRIQSKNKIPIRLSTNRTIVNACGFRTEEKLSCCDMLSKEVWLNYHRWKYGSKASKLNLYRYREYMINHEVGHALGRLHAKCPCKDCPAPIMMQHTITIGACSPNSKPLHNE